VFAQAYGELERDLARLHARDAAACQEGKAAFIAGMLDVRASPGRDTGTGRSRRPSAHHLIKQPETTACIPCPAVEAATPATRIVPRMGERQGHNDTSWTSDRARSLERCFRDFYDAGNVGDGGDDSGVGRANG
jgi:hypothetical protein